MSRSRVTAAAISLLGKEEGLKVELAGELPACAIKSRPQLGRIALVALSTMRGAAPLNAGQKGRRLWIHE